MNNMKLILACSILVGTNTYAAETPMRPGLWEVNTTSNLLNYASQMSPEQMQGLKDMAKEYGLEVPEIQNGTAKSYTCITPEMAKEKLLPDSFQNQMGCAVNKITHAGNQYYMEFTCDNPQVKGNGTADGTFTSAESFVGKTNFKGLAQGIQVNEQAEITGKWSSASCENARP
jgi:hypothetical protein